MSVNIRTFQAMNHSVVDNLWNLGFRTNTDILDQTANPQDRRLLAKKAELDETLLLDLACRADLARIKGIGNLYAVLLKHAGINTVQDMAQQQAAELHERLIKLNTEMRISRRIPKLINVEGWVESARSLSPVIQD